MTGHHRGPKRKLRAGYGVPSIQCMSYLCVALLRCAFYIFLSSSVVSHAFSALCTYLTFRHHPHPLGYPCAKFHFCGNLRCWGIPWRKIAYSINQSLSQSLTHPAYLWCLTELIWCPGNRSFRFRTKHKNPWFRSPQNSNQLFLVRCSTHSKNFTKLLYTVLRS